MLEKHSHMHMTRLTALFLPLLFWYLVCFNAAYAVEIQSLTGVIVTDAQGNEISECSPSQPVRYEAVFTPGTPVIAIVKGKVTGEGWSKILNPQLRFGFIGAGNVAWESKIPLNASGIVQVSVTAYSLLPQPARTAVFTITPINADYVGSENCRPCHPQIYAAWLETKHAVTVGCETCHGPGSAHIETLSPDKIIVDTSTDVCTPCHMRNNGNSIKAENGFIVSQQQYNEYVSTKHGKYFDCTTCHDPHYSVTTARQQAIKVNCRSCHSLKTIGLGMQQVECESCHMPPAVKSETSTGSGLYRRGDTPSHIWRIKTEAQPQQMFFGPVVVKDAKGPFLTLNFACLTCHNGSISRLYDFTSVQQTATLVH